MTLTRLLAGISLIPFAWFFLISWKVLGALGFSRASSWFWITALRITTIGSNLLKEEE